jgi:hypothetical protein
VFFPLDPRAFTLDDRLLAVPDHSPLETNLKDIRDFPPLADEAPERFFQNGGPAFLPPFALASVPSAEVRARSGRFLRKRQSAAYISSDRTAAIGQQR